MRLLVLAFAAGMTTTLAIIRAEVWYLARKRKRSQ